MTSNRFTSRPHHRKRDWGGTLSAIVGLQLLTVGSAGLLSPILSIVMTEYFARMHRGGSPIDCGSNSQDETCTAGSRQAASLSSIYSAFGCMGNFILSPMLGQASDVYGRKPFLVLSQVLRLGLPFSIIFFMQSGGSIIPYFVLRLIDSAFGSSGVMSAAIADIVLPEDRAAAFGILFASIAVGYCASAFTAPFFSKNHSLHIAIVVFGLRVLWAIFILPETLPLRTRTKARWKVENPVSSMAILFRDELFILLTCLIALTSFAMNGVFQIQSFFLNTIVGFNAKDFGNLMLFGGVLALLGQILFLNPLVKCVKERGVIVIALVASMIETCGFAVIAYYPHKWLVYVVSLSGCLRDLSFPAISALKSRNASEKEQGRLQGAIYGARSIFEALGPVIFASLYGAMTRQSVWSQAFPFCVASVIYFIGIVVAFCLPTKNSHPSKTSFIPVPVLSPSFVESPNSMSNTDIDEMDEFEWGNCATKADLDVSSLAEPLLDNSSET